MEQFPLLDIIVGLTAVFTFVSLLASELTATVLRFLKWNDKFFIQGVVTLLGEESSLKNGSKKLDGTISYKILKALCNNSTSLSFTWTSKSIYPDEVSPTVFAEVLLDILYGLSQNHQDSLKYEETAIDTISALSQAIQSSRELNSQLKINLQQLIQRVQFMEAKSDQQLMRLKQELGRWFRYAMVDISATCQHRSKVVSFVVSAMLVLIINLDSLYIIRRISENTATRAIVIQNATNIKACQKSLNSPECRERMTFVMERTTIPIGWWPSNIQKQFDQVNGVILMRTIGGWLFSSIAISKGSHFWLRILSRLRISLKKKR